MKTKKLFSLFLVAALALGFASCDSDDDENEKENKFTYGDINSKLISGAYAGYSDGNYHVFYLLLIGEGLSVNFANLESSGSGYAHQLQLISIDGTLEGDYSYVEPTSSPVSTKSVLEADLFYGLTLSYVVTDDEESPQTVGRFDNRETSVSIKKDGDKYEVTIKGKDEDGKSLELYYKGVLPQVNMPS